MTTYPDSNLAYRQTVSAKLLEIRPIDALYLALSLGKSVLAKCTALVQNLNVITVLTTKVQDFVQMRIK